MLTPRQYNEVCTSIRRSGLEENDFKVNDGKSEVRVGHIPTSFYFSLSLTVANSENVSLANVIIVKHMTFKL